MNSRLLECRLLHHRIWPREHRFSNRLFYLAADLDEIEPLTRNLRLLGRRAGNLFSLRDGDYLPAEDAPAGPRPLRAKVVQLLQRHGLEVRPADRITLVALPRIAGYLFNPVSFFFLARDGENFAAIAEVTNTFREVKTYVLGPADRGSDDGLRLRTGKNFYVSPFSSPGTEFEFHLRLSPDALAVRIDEHQDGRRLLRTVLSGRSRPLTDARLAWFAVKYPFLSLQVITRIHAQAFRLYCKGLPWWRKDDRPDLQRDFLPARSRT
jgi:DUF1365 family protein